MRSWKLVVFTAALAGVAGCSTESGKTAVDSTPPAPTSTTSSDSVSGATSGSTAAPSDTGGGSSVPTLVNVNLENVLNNISVSLQVNRNSVPVTAQVPINVAAAVCGVSVDALAASVASGHGSCTATTTTPQLNQIVQQQISTGGNVQGGDQTLSTGASTAD